MNHEPSEIVQRIETPAARASTYQPIVAREAINIRLARPDGPDMKFIDDLQKKHAKMVSFWPRMQLEASVKKGNVLIAETPPPSLPDGRPIPNVRGTPLGYVIGTDRYFKREDVGIIYQLNVTPGRHRSLIGASLVQAMFERAAWGCKLFCCWCAQDLEANYFWESIGFVPLAFRTGSEKKARIHIFWQKRIREGDKDTAYWFPSMTTGGAIREGRLVIPIPPGTHWSEAKPMVLPGVPVLEDASTAAGLLPGGSDEKKQVKAKRRHPRNRKASAAQQKASDSGGLWFGGASSDGGGGNASAAESHDEPAEEKKSAPKRKAKKKESIRGRHYHPKYVEAARELCARFLHEVQSEGGERLLAASSEESAKHDVRRMLEGSVTPKAQRQEALGSERLLDAA